MAKAFPDIVTVIASLPDVVLDAELVVPDARGRSDFGELQRRSLMRRLPIIEDAAARRPAALIVFDVLQADGADLRQLPLSERKAWLPAHVTARPGLHIMEGVETHGEALFAAMVEQGFEGIVGKKLDSPYNAGRQPTWQKIKNPGYSRKDALGFGR
jgi:bifunctional non-homologous end joining protein LigD